MTEREVLVAWQERRGIEQELLSRFSRRLVWADEDTLRGRLAVVDRKLIRELRRRERKELPTPARCPVGGKS